jgi:hypothetical protein
LNELLNGPPGTDVAALTEPTDAKLAHKTMKSKNAFFILISLSDNRIQL